MTAYEFYRLGALQGRVGNGNRVPSKKAGRRGTRRAWKRAHPPGWQKIIWQYFDIQPAMLDVSSLPDHIIFQWY